MGLGSFPVHQHVEKQSQDWRQSIRKEKKKKIGKPFPFFPRNKQDNDKWRKKMNKEKKKKKMLDIITQFHSFTHGKKKKRMNEDANIESKKKVYQRA